MRAPLLVSRAAGVAVAATVAVAVAVGGCGGSASGAGTRSATGAAAGATTTASTGSGGGGAGAIGTSGTGSGAGAALPGAGRPPVILGDTNTPEQFILGALYDAALTGAGYTVERTRNIGTVAVRSQSMLQGSLDLYPEYLNVWNGQIAGYRRSFRTLAGAWRAGQAYAVSHDLELLPATPFSDTSGLAVMRRYANAHRLRSLGDLRRLHAEFSLGAPPEFISAPAGLPALEHAYGFLPATTHPLTIGAQYLALRTGQVSVAYVSTTDGQLSQPQYRLLADPRHIMGFGNVVPVVSARAIAREGPALAATIERVDALLTQGVMQGLNAEVELGHHDPDIVAREFLLGNGIPITSATATTTTTTATTLTTPPLTTTTSGTRRRHHHR